MKWLLVFLFLNLLLTFSCFVLIRTNKKWSSEPTLKNGALPITYKTICMTQIPNFKNDPVVVLILSIFTCGLYLIYWNIKAAQVINAVADKEIISQPVAIFAGCCFPINLYFYYLAGKEGLPKIYEKTGETSKDQSTLLIILGFFFPMVAAMIVQGDINKLYK